MPSRVTRSGRVVKHPSRAQEKLDALELLARRRQGEKVDQPVKEDEPLYEEVDEEEYRRTHKGGFVVDPDSDEEYSELDDFIDDADEDDAYGNNGKGSSRGRDKNSRKKASKEIEHDPRQRSMKSFLGGGSTSTASSSRSFPSIPSSKGDKKKEINQDEILSQMLFDVPVGRSTSIQKPTKILSRLPTTPSTSSTSNVSRTPKTKATYDSTSVKRPRMSSPPSRFSDEAGMLDNWQGDDDFEDSMPAFALPPVDSEGQTKGNTIPHPDRTIEIDSGDDFSQDIGFEAVPLNDDLKCNLEFHSLDGGKNFTRMYWYDCCEDPIRNPGIVYFFGRIYATSAKRFVSCCTIVKNIQRTCYLAIDSDSTYEQAVGEFTHIIAKKFKIKNFTCQKVTKKYAFSSDSKVPLVSDYVQIDYPANQPLLPTDLKGETFSCVLNVNQTAMEKTILDLKLRGPCWLRLVDPVAPNPQLTWTRIELVLESPQNLLVEENLVDLPAPYFCTLSLSMTTYSNPYTHQNEIIAIAGMVNTTFILDQCLKRNNKASGHFCIMTKPPAGHKELKLPFDFHIAARKYNKTRFELVDSERDLLMNFMDKFINLDPDIVVGHDLLNFDYETLVMRMKVTKLNVWSKLGRFKRTELPSTKAAFRNLFTGRVLCDIRTSAMELIHARSYDLTQLTSQILQKTRVELDHSAIVESFKSSDGLIRLLNATWEDNDSILSILVELNVVPLALKITNITGNILSRTLAAGRSERNEYLLLHAFHEDNFICPEKQISYFNKRNNNSDKSNNAEPKELAPTRKKAAYSGGLVLEPMTGYYESCVLLMDFNSLYPSIIQEFNICFSTIEVPTLKGADENTEIIAKIPSESVANGVLPTQLRNLVEGRRRVKRLLAETKSADQKTMLDIEQKALKLTANSMYGCLGFEQSRFYAKHLASLVTFKGREILMSTKAMVEKLGYEVIYGDTDSLMINTKLTDYDEVILRGNSIKGEINRTFKLLEIDIDGVYKPLLLLKKKNYAGASIKKLADGQFSKSVETKGLDTVRRDRAIIAKEAGERVLEMILSDGKEIDQTVEDIHNYLKQLGDSIRSDQEPREKFLISKQLNRNPEEYRSTKGVGHIALALRYNSDPKRTKKMKSGDTVDYVICLDNTTESANQRAYSLEELATRTDLKLDYEYYLCQQIHPVMTRICDKLPITNAYVLAEMLGVEKSNLLHIRREESNVTKRDQLISKGESRFASCRPLVITCPSCSSTDEIATRTRKNKEQKLELSVTNCPGCGSRYAMRAKLIVTQILFMIKRLTQELYTSRYVCENKECDYHSRNLFCPLTNEDTATKTQPVCELCESPMLAEMDDKRMDLQLGFYRYLFDERRARESDTQLECTEDVIELYQSCYKEIEYALRSSFINNVDAYTMFGMVCSGRHTDEQLQLQQHYQQPQKQVRIKKEILV